jgi:hypothetical protein
MLALAPGSASRGSRGPPPPTAPRCPGSTSRSSRAPARCSVGGSSMPARAPSTRGRPSSPPACGPPPRGCLPTRTTSPSTGWKRGSAKNSPVMARRSTCSPRGRAPSTRTSRPCLSPARPPLPRRVPGSRSASRGRTSSASSASRRRSSSAPSPASRPPPAPARSVAPSSRAPPSKAPSSPPPRPGALFRAAFRVKERPLPALGVLLGALLSFVGAGVALWPGKRPA